jgi:hypothetical protein
LICFSRYIDIFYDLLLSSWDNKVKVKEREREREREERVTVGEKEQKQNNIVSTILFFSFVCFISITKLAHVEDVELVFPIAENLMWINEIKEINQLCRLMQSNHVYRD